MKTIAQWKEDYKNNSRDVICRSLKDTVNTITFLENIYQCGGEHRTNFDLSESFRDAAYKERQALCQKSSALFSLIRERENIPDNITINV